MPTLQTGSSSGGTNLQLSRFQWKVQASDDPASIKARGEGHCPGDSQWRPASCSSKCPLRMLFRSKQNVTAAEHLLY